MEIYNEKIINEWNKIKNYKIFNSINEFAILFDTNPNGSCYKKYSNYPWNKENFFFGEYKDLLNFYKTSTEVPFYLKDMIGKKYGQLELKSFNVKIKNNKRVYYANCICDCGKKCEKEYSKIIEGHVTTCGEHKQKHKGNLLTNFKEIVEKHWDYDKNNDLPENVDIKSEKEFWWKDETGSFKLKPKELTKRKFGTSFHEQCIYFYIQQLFCNVKNRHKLKINNSSYEADIFIQDYNIAIEYDGVFWHKEKYQNDLEKSKLFNANNINLIRVRESGLPPIDLELTKTIWCNFNDTNFYKTINQIVLLIKQLCHLSEKDLFKVSNFALTQDQFEEDKIKILDQYRTNYIENNITKTCLIKYWDYDKNNIIPQKVSLQDDINIWFKCPYGFNKEINIKQLSKDNNLICNNPINCLNCDSFYCPFRYYCVATNTWENYYVYSTSINRYCPKMKKYLYYEIFIEPSRNVEYSQCIGKSVNNDSDSLYNIESIYQRHRNELLNDNNLLLSTKQAFDSINLTTQFFKNLEDLHDFLTNYRPVIKSINYEDFDIDDAHREFLLNVLDSYNIAPHIWEDYKNKLSDSFFNIIKEKNSKHFIELSLKIFNIEELKQIIKKYNPKISNVMFSDFNINTEYKEFLITILANIPYFNGVLSDWAYAYMPKWQINKLNSLQQAIGIKEIELNENNIYNYIEVNWEQRKDLVKFGISFKKLIQNSFVKIDSLVIDFKDEIKDLLFKNVSLTPKRITPDIAQGLQHVIYMGKKNPVFKDFPFVLKDIKGSVLIF